MTGPETATARSPRRVAIVAVAAVLAASGGYLAGSRSAHDAGTSLQEAVRGAELERLTSENQRLHARVAELDMSLDDFQETLTRISNSSVVALDELWTLSDSSGDQVSLLDTIQDPDAVDPAHAMDATETKDRLADAIARLPEREKLVIALYYYENLTLREIGEVLGVTESRISQLHTKAVLRLKSRLQSDDPR